MRVYTYSEARQKFSDLLDRAGKEGEVRVRRRDGSEYVIRPYRQKESPLDVSPVEAEISAADIIEAVRESRERAAG